MAKKLTPRKPPALISREEAAQILSAAVRDAATKDDPRTVIDGIRALSGIQQWEAAASANANITGINTVLERVTAYVPPAPDQD